MDKLSRLIVFLMKVLWQIPLIIIISVGIALGFNQLRPKTLPLICPWSQSVLENTFSEYVSTVSVEEAAALFHSDKAVFIDARPEYAYDRGHIKGALCLPWNQAEEKCFDVIESLPPDKKIITYCDGATCDLCDKLAVFLCDLGFDDVQALINGWTIWNQHSLPVDVSENS
jgi:rhodanese-related sulfurtransferase